jgi:hypothetical protein
MRKASLAISFLASAVIVGQLRGVLGGSPLLTSMVFSIYPAVVVAIRSESEVMDSGYLAAVFFSIGGILAYGQQFPVGFGDAYKHTATIVQSFNNGFVQILFTTPSQNFISYYIYIASISSLLDINIVAVAQYAPMMFVFLTVIIFYVMLSRVFNSQGFWLFGTLSFSFMYGVFRFATEFRTLNLGLPLAVMLTAFFLMELVRKTGWRIRLISFILALSLTISHFGSFFISSHLLLALALVIAWRKKAFAPLAVIIGGVIILFLYMDYLGESLTFLSLQGVTSLRALILGTGAGPAAEGGLGSPFRDAILLETIQWSIRVGFIIAASTSGLHWLLTDRDDFRLALFIGLGIMGLATVGSVLGFSVGLNPGRYLTFLAIPYGLVYADGLRIWLTQPRVSDRVKHFAVIILVVFLILSVLPVFPSSIVGPTEPLRESNGSEPDIYHVSKDDVKAAEFTNDRLGGKVLYKNARNPIFYKYWGMKRFRSHLSGDNGQKYFITRLPANSENNIYTNGNTYITNNI